jgi:hypothetical protein
MQKSPSSIAALIGFALASASALLAIWLRSYAYAVGGLAHQDPLLLEGLRTGIALSSAGCIFAIAGLRPPSRERWLGFAWALLGLLFWVGTVVLR